MKNADLIFDIIPKDLFDIRRDGDFVSQVQHLIEQQQAATGGAVVASAEGECGLDLDPERVGVALSDAIGSGDWRLYFLARDRMRALTLDRKSVV